MGDPTQLRMLPHWQSHKVVQADQVCGVLAEPLRWVLRCGAIMDVSAELERRVTHDTPFGGYYVKYSDGFESWSPQEAFEDGYTRITHDARTPGSTG
jgi:hypothetical protein